MTPFQTIALFVGSIVIILFLALVAIIAIVIAFGIADSIRIARRMKKLYNKEPYDAQETDSED